MCLGGQGQELSMCIFEPYERKLNGPKSFKNKHRHKIYSKNK